MKVGIRELRAGLSGYLKGKEEVEVTEWGKVIGRYTPVGCVVKKVVEGTHKGEGKHVQSGRIPAGESVGF